MKQSLKMLVLGCMTIGALAGCEWGKPSGTSQESSGHYQQVAMFLVHQQHNHHSHHLPQLVTHLLVLVHPQQVHQQAWHQLSQVSL